MNALRWIATSICLVGNAINVKRIRFCFILWVVGETMWLAHDAALGMYSRCILDAVGLGMAAWGIWEHYIRKGRGNG